MKTPLFFILLNFSHQENQKLIKSQRYKYLIVIVLVGLELNDIRLEPLKLNS